MKPTTAIILAAVAVAGLYGLKAYQAAKAKEAAAGEWSSLIGMGTSFFKKWFK